MGLDNHCSDLQTVLQSGLQKPSGEGLLYTATIDIGNMAGSHRDYCIHGHK